MKSILLTLAFFVTALCGNAQLLWKVSGNGAKGDSYLFGTHHVAPYTMMDSVAGFNDALRAADVVIGEIDMINADMAQMQQLMLARAMAPSDSMLTTLMTSQQLDSLDVVLAKYTGGQMNHQAVAPLKPAMLTTMLAMLQTTAVFPDYDESKQLDTMVQKRAHNAGKPIAGLETIEEQIGFLLDSPIAEQIEQLLECVRHDAESGQMARDLANAYLSQDLAKVNELLVAENEDSEVMKRLIGDRNTRWVQKLVELLPRNNVLVAVGCGHLPGETGLIEQLRTLGYTVTPVK